MDANLGAFCHRSSLIFLYVEIFKSTRTSNDSPILDHMASLGLFVICMVEFMMAKVAGTSTFFIILMMTLVDVIGGLQFLSLVRAEISVAAVDGET